MHMDNENHSPALFGFDLFRLFSFQLHTYGFSLAILPDWFWVSVNCHLGQGEVLAGSLAGRGFGGVRWSTEPLPAGAPLFDVWSESGSPHARIGRVWFYLDEKAGQAVGAAEAE
jgi:hypothetical protein